MGRIIPYIQQITSVLVTAQMKAYMRVSIKHVNPGGHCYWVGGRCEISISFMVPSKKVCESGLLHISLGRHLSGEKNEQTKRGVS